MLVILNSRTEPAFNLAAEEFLLTAARLGGEGPGQAVMFWRNSPSVIVGRNQNSAAEVNLAEARRRGIPIIRRLTGGGAVYHDLGNINYSIITDIDSGIAGTDAAGMGIAGTDNTGTGAAAGKNGGRENAEPANTARGIDFSFWTRPVLAALKKLGLAVSLSGRNDLMVETPGGAFKFSGSAQGRTGNRRLHHGTLLFSTDFSVMEGLLTPDAAKFRSHAVHSVQSRVTNLGPLLPKGMTPEQVIEKIIAEMTAEWGQDCEKRPFEPEEIEKIEALSREKYSRWEWNIGHSPKADFSAEHRFPWGKLTVSLTLNRGRIESGLIFGDFFTDADPNRLIERLSGAKFDRPSVSERLSKEEIRAVFPDLSGEDFLNLLFDADPA